MNVTIFHFPLSSMGSLISRRRMSIESRSHTFSIIFIRVNSYTSGYYYFYNFFIIIIIIIIVIIIIIIIIVLIGAFISILSNQSAAWLTVLKTAAKRRYLMCKSSPYPTISISCTEVYPPARKVHAGSFRVSVVHRSRPGMTFAVDWVLKANYLSILP